MMKERKGFVKYDGRICFAISYFDSEESAMAYDKEVREEGRTYNGGFYHGMPCGRDKTFDHKDKETGKQLYGVTH